MAGYEFAADAADEGITQTLASLTAGANYVIRPGAALRPDAIPKIAILDATNTDAPITSLTCPNQLTDLVANGGFDSDTASWSSAWHEYLK